MKIIPPSILQTICIRYPAYRLFLSELTPTVISSPDIVTLPEEKVLNEIDLLYIYGLGRGNICQLLQSWLSKKSERHVIFIEDDFACVANFLASPYASAIENSRIHIRHIFDPNSLEEFCIQCASEFPMRYISILSNKTGKHAFFERMQFLLFRHTTMQEASMAECILYPKLLQNVYKNMYFVPEMTLGSALKDQCKNIPAIICGGGPSLVESISELRQIEQSALIFAGGSGITALTQHNIQPHVSVAIDPNEMEWSQLREMNAFMAPMCFAPRVFSEIHALHNGPLIYLQMLSSGKIETIIEDKLEFPKEYLWDVIHPEANSVTTLGIAYAVFLGCNPLYLCGVDLAYTSGLLYADGVIAHNKLLEKPCDVGSTIIYEKGFRGEDILTAIKWTIEASWISQFAQNHSHVKIYRASLQGLPIQGVSFRALSTLLSHPKRDLESMFFSLVQRKKKNCCIKKIKKSMAAIQDSTERSYKLCQQIVHALQEEDETTKNEPISVTLAILDLQQEEIYQKVFVDFQEKFAFFFNTMYPEHTANNIQYTIWKNMEQNLEECLEVFTNV